MKKILILGATGAMAVYLIPLLLEKGCEVTGVALDDAAVTHKSYTHIKGNAMDLAFLREELAKEYDAVVDFMIYNVPRDFAPYMELFLAKTKHYVFLSTYRVYGNEYPITESSLRVKEMEKDADFVFDKEYCIYKAEEEDMLRASGKKNFSIVRPSITFSKSRFQLTTLEASILVYRMLTGKTVILPECAMEIEATMTWAGDTARMFAAVIGNEKAFGETYTFATAEHHKWREVAETYVKLGGLKYITVPEEDYLELISPKADGYQRYARQQLRYDRCFHRVVDNSKILSLMGETQEDLTPLAEGLRRELAGVTLDMIPKDPIINARMDGYLLAKGLN